MIRTRTGRTLGLAALALAVQAGAAAAQQLPPAAEVVEKYVQAIGGRATAERFSARHVTAEMSMPAMGMTMTMQSWIARPNRTFSRMEMSGMAITSGFDGTTAWVNSPMSGPKILDGPELRQALDNANFDNNVDFAKVFPTMETVGERTVAGRACWNVKMVSANGTEVHTCFDKETGLLVGTVSKQHTQMGEITADIVMSDYKEFDGLKLPTRMTMTMGPQQVVTTIKSVSHAPIADSVFALPPEIKALQR
jgi:hypothetical protein